MKTKLFNALKQDHSKLGLSDEVLQAYADSLASTGLVTDENLATISKGQETALKAYQSAIDKERTEKVNYKSELDALKAKGGDPKPNPQPTPTPADDLDAKLEALLAEKMKPYKEKIEGYETKEKNAARQAQILGKAKELKISQERIDEGFVIGDDADETAINTYLSKVAQNEVARGLEKGSAGHPLSDEKEGFQNLMKEIGNSQTEKK